MKNKKLLLLPLFALLIAGCTPTTSSSGESSGSASTPTTSISVEDSEDLPSIPPSSESSQTEIPDEPVSIEEARASEGKTVTIRGKVTFIYGMASSSLGVILQQGDNAITAAFVTKEAAAGIAVGDHVETTGTVALFNGLVQLTVAKGVVWEFKKLDTAAPVVTPLVLTQWVPAELAGKDGRLVKVEGLQYVSGSVPATGNGDIKVKLGETQFSLYVSGYIDNAERDGLRTKIAGLKSSDTITFEGPLGWYTVPQLNPVTNSTVTIVEGTSTGPVAPTALSFGETSAKLAPEETLQLNLQVTPSDADITDLVYASSVPTVATVSSTGLITALAVGTTNVTATAGGKVATIAITVDVDTHETLWKLDFSQSAWISDDKPAGAYYSYSNSYNVVMKHGTTELNWLMRGSNPNDWKDPAMRFGSKQSNPKLNTVINSGLPMSNDVAETLSAMFAQGKDPIAGSVDQIVVSIHSFFTEANFTKDKVYVQASATADFAAPINIGEQSLVAGELTFPITTALENHYYRVIFGVIHTVDKNSGVLVSGVSFNTSIVA